MTCRGWLAEHPEASPQDVRFVVLDERLRDVFAETLNAA